MTPDQISSESIEFDNEFVESYSTISSDDESTQSVLDSWQSELQLCTLQGHDPVGDSVEDQKKLSHGQSPHNETLIVDSKRLDIQKSKRLILHISDPFFEGNNVHERPVTKSCDRTCNENQMIDLPVSKVEADNLATECRLESTMSGSLSSQTQDNPSFDQINNV